MHQLPSAQILMHQLPTQILMHQLPTQILMHQILMHQLSKAQLPSAQLRSTQVTFCTYVLHILHFGRATIGPVIGDGSSASGNPDFQNNASTEGRVYVHIKADVRHAVGVNVTEILQQFLFNLTLGLCDDCKVDINTTVTPDQITVF
ncbi:uncharacterized protein LOC144015002 isoform X6 [Festucalex cinctus]